MYLSPAPSTRRNRTNTREYTQIHVYYARGSITSWPWPSSPERRPPAPARRRASVSVSVVYFSVFLLYHHTVPCGPKGGGQPEGEVGVYRLRIHFEYSVNTCIRSSGTNTFEYITNTLKYRLLRDHPHVHHPSMYFE